MKGDGLTLWNAIAIFETSKTWWLKGKLCTKDDFENHSKDRQFLLEEWLIIIRFQRETYQEYINLAPCGFFVSVSASDFQRDRCFVTFGSPLFIGKSWLAMEGVRHLFHVYMLAHAHLSRSR